MQRYFFLSIVALVNFQYQNLQTKPLFFPHHTVYFLHEAYIIN